MKKHLTILTGASRGLGAAMAEQLLTPGHQLLTISRHPADLRPVPGAVLEQWAMDLADSQSVAARLQSWLQTLDPLSLASATLINNAGVTPSPAPLGSTSAADLSNAIRVGLEAPLLLTAAFLRVSDNWRLPRKVLLISSGLGRRAMGGASSYCAAKAGVDHLARALALEQAQMPHGAAVVSLAPGVIDTDMQVQLRSADATQFPDRARFVDLKDSGQLDSPAQAASKVLAYLVRSDFGSQPVADVRDPG